MAQGDRKIYIGETLISDKSKDELEQLMDQLMDYLIASGGQGSGVNADLLDGLDSTDFATAEQGEKANNSLQLGLVRIGNTWLTNGDNILDGNSLILSDNGTTALLNTGSSDCESITLKEVDECIRCLGLDDESNILLEDALLFLRCLLFRSVNSLNQNKVEIEYQDPDNTIPKVLSDNNFSNYYKGLLDTLKELKLFMDGDGLNATSINGIKFRLVTKEQYNELSENSKLDPYMIYITVDEIPADYVPPSADGEPPSIIEFKVEENDEEELGIWYKNSYATDQQWHELITFKNIFESFDFNELVSSENISSTINNFSLEQIEDSVFLAKNPYKDIILNAIQGVKYNNNIISPTVNNIVELPKFITESDLASSQSLNDIRSSINNINRTLSTQGQNIGINSNNINTLRSTLNTKSNIGHTHSINEITNQKMYILEIPPIYSFQSSCGKTDGKIILRRIGNTVNVDMDLGILNPGPQSTDMWGFVPIAQFPFGFRLSQNSIYSTPYTMPNLTKGIYYSINANLKISDYQNKTDAYENALSKFSFVSNPELGKGYRFIYHQTYLTLDPFPTEELSVNHYNSGDAYALDMKKITYKEVEFNPEW